MPLNTNVYHVSYSYPYYGRVETCGGMDSEPTGKVIKRDAQWNCVCEDASVAVAAFNSLHPANYIVNGVTKGIQIQKVISII